MPKLLCLPQQLLLLLILASVLRPCGDRGMACNGRRLKTRDAICWPKGILTLKKNLWNTFCLSFSGPSCPEAGKLVLQETQKNKAEPNKRSFWPNAVAQERSCGFSMETRLLLLNGAEWFRTFGVRPRVKDLRCPCVELPTLTGEVEKHWVFKASKVEHMV